MLCSASPWRADDVFLSRPVDLGNENTTSARILTVSIFKHSPKLYISELGNGSQTVAALNEQFRHLAPNLDILSFYETLQNSIGPKKMVRSVPANNIFPALP
jgi:hypothetical protein